MAGITRLVIMVSEGPYASLKPYTALRYARSASGRGLDTRVIFVADGIHCVRRGVGRGSSTVGDFEALIKELIKEGIKVEACQSPMRLFSLTQQDLIEGVEVAHDVIGHTLDEETAVIWL
jgi:predicted peroxiredoxin